MLKITSKADSIATRIYFNGILHRKIDTERLIDIQSWVQGNPPEQFWIEYTYSDGTSVKSMYDSKRLWVGVLKIMDQ